MLTIRCKICVNQYIYIYNVNITYNHDSIIFFISDSQIWSTSSFEDGKIVVFSESPTQVFMTSQPVDSSIEIKMSEIEILSLAELKMLNSNIEQFVAYRTKSKLKSASTFCNWDAFRSSSGNWMEKQVKKMKILENIQSVFLCMITDDFFFESSLFLDVRVLAVVK